MDGEEWGTKSHDEEKRKSVIHHRMLYWFALPYRLWIACLRSGQSQIRKISSTHVPWGKREGKNRALAVKVSLLNLSLRDPHCSFHSICYFSIPIRWLIVFHLVSKIRLMHVICDNHYLRTWESPQSRAADCCWYFNRGPSISALLVQEIPPRIFFIFYKHSWLPFPLG